MSEGAWITCPDCGGDGYDWDGGQCTTCGGTGEVYRDEAFLD
ncbi:hypothetical protein [Clostridioides difficile]